MIKPDLFDVIELLVDIPELKLQAGDRGAIVEKYSDRAYEVEFTNSEGETLALCTISPEQFIVIWQAKRVIADKLEQGEISLGLITLPLIPYVSEQEQGELDIMFGSPSDYKDRESIDMTDWVKHNYKQRKLIELREQIAEGTQQIREGKVIDGELVFQQLKDKLNRKDLF